MKVFNTVVGTLTALCFIAAIALIYMFADMVVLAEIIGW